jgi:pimeloyl-ACP methyl ester carboxylesterase
MMTWILEDAAKQNAAIVEEATDNFHIGLRSFKPIRLVNPTVLTDEEWQSIELPTLFLIGENEKTYSAQRAVERLETVAPAIQTEVIPGAGHDLTLVQADSVNRVILGFLSES